MRHCRAQSKVLAWLISSAGFKAKKDCSTACRWLCWSLQWIVYFLLNWLDSEYRWTINTEEFLQLVQYVEAVLLRVPKIVVYVFPSFKLGCYEQCDMFVTICDFLPRRKHHSQFEDLYIVGEHHNGAIIRHNWTLHTWPRDNPSPLQIREAEKTRLD